MSALRILCLPLLVLGLTGVLLMAAVQPDPQERWSQAQQKFNDGNYRDALELVRPGLQQGEFAPQEAAQALSLAVRCLDNLKQEQQIDQLLHKTVDAYPDQWRVLWRSAELIYHADHYGFVVAGEFHRGGQRGGGAFVNVFDRDRAQALIWMNAARQKLPRDLSEQDRGQFFTDFAEYLSQSSDDAWKLLDLTDLSELPEIPVGEEAVRSIRYWPTRNDPQGAPVDREGNPIFHQVPNSFEDARTDGERWRWALRQAAQVNGHFAAQSTQSYARFLHQQFGVQTLARWGIRLSGDDDQATRSSIWELSSLKENETIARLANGVKRFTLPEEHNFIRLFRKNAESDQSRFAIDALRLLATLFENRRQYPQAAEEWRKFIEKTPDEKNVGKEHLKQIVGNWGEFEPVQSAAAGSGMTVDYRFRNGESVTFVAHRIKIPELIADVQKYLQSSPQQVDWDRTQIENIGYRLVKNNETKYLGEKAAEWTLDLNPRENHFDSRVTVTTPLQKAGAYLVTAKMQDGNTSRIILWLNDTAILRKELNGRTLYFIADAKTGQPILNAKVDFFGWQQHRVENTKRQFRVLTQRFADFSDENGMIVAGSKLMPSGYQWMAVARTADGRFAHLGFQNIWFGSYRDERPSETKVYLVTDRPVYRPEQPVQFKFWIRQANYDDRKNDPFARRDFTVKIYDPQGTEVFSQNAMTDEYGGLSGTYTLPEDAPLGMYSARLEEGKKTWGAGSFRVEEYKKPEFEVTIDAPEKPVQLGETVTATIGAKYYYGAPVTNALVHVKVERSPHNSRWFPYDPWDWLYGEGYWWFTPASTWYPGFRTWGCFPPYPGGWNAQPPELVLDQELEIGDDGTVEIEIDTSLAKELHGDEDHKYAITAEVVDASRRTIVGQGNVLVSRKPYQIFSWTHRGYYRVGQTIEAHFQARTIAGNGVQGSGKLTLYKVRYDNGKPVEEAVQTWDLATDDEGQAKQTLTAAEAGQYRLSFVMSTGKEEPEIEGGVLFVVRGDGFDGSEFQFNDLELIADKKNYQPGENVRLMINTDQPNSTVLLFVRPVGGIAAGRPQVLHIDGKSTVVDLDVKNEDMPNFFVEAVTISQGHVYDRIQELTVPPQKQLLDVEITPSQESYLPGAKAEIDVKVTGPDGKPFQGSLVLSVYDRAVEYISGGSNVADIREFFWKWKRHHYARAESNLENWFHQLLKDSETPMHNLGVFGGSVADEDLFDEYNSVQMPDEFRRRRGAFGIGGGMGGEKMMMESMAAPASSLELAVAAPKQAADQAQELVQPTVRTEFADTAYWKADLTTNADGTAHVAFTMPENLSSWKLRAWGMGADVEVGEASTNVVTAKNLVVRLQAPRFFTETDEVVLSAVVHNYLKTQKQVEVSLELKGGTLELMQGTLADATQTVTIPAGGETRVDWRVKATSPGTATVTMKALTDEESDAMQMTFPVQVHGILKTESYSGLVKSDESKSTIEIFVPEDRQPEKSRLEIRYSPTLAGAMVDALPYLAEYPYGCTEQTLNRFLPTVITQTILREMGLDLKEIKRKRTNLNAQEIGDAKERAKQWKRFDRNPVFDKDKVALMVKTGVKDLVAMQNSDGGWGWFSGFGEHSTPHMTALVVHGLQLAVQNHVALPDGVLERGRAWLKQYQDEQVALLQEGERHAKDNKRDKSYKSQASNLDALVFSVLVEGDVENDAMQGYLYRDRTKLSLYSQSLLGLALDDLGAQAERDMVVRNIDQFIKVDHENQTAYLNLPNDSYWWFWYGNQVEANAHYLKLLCRVDPKGEKAAGLAKYLINNRNHGTWWNSTRDTAYCIEALADYLQASDELQPRMLVEVWIDGEKRQSVKITPEVLFTFDNSFVIEGADLESGRHRVEIRRQPLDDQPAVGPLYFNAYVTNFTTEDFITAAGLEIRVARAYYKLVQQKDAETAVPGDRGQVVDQSVLKYDRIPLDNLDDVQSGDLIEVELKIESKNDYEYVVFEDWKAAGLEPVDLRSGYTRGGLGAYVEFRDEKVAFFIRQLERGTHSVSYRLRAEIPGKFSALPTQAHAMYAPELKANADEMKLQIQDRE